MKNIQSFLGTLALTLLAATMGCTLGNPCKKVECVNGECVDGTCECAPGYTGADCATADPCYNVACINGSCVSGTCDCDNGYEGADCSQPLNAKFSGTYILTESCSLSGATSYAVTVAPKSGTIYQVHFTGLWEVAQSIVVADIVNNSNNFRIPRQVLSPNIEIESTAGTISQDGTQITLAYNIYTNGNLAESCAAQLSK